MKLLIVILLLLLSLTSSASPDRSWYVGGGIFNHNLSRVSGDQTTQKSTLGTAYLPVQARTFWNLGNNYYWSPQVTFTQITSYLIPRETPEGGAKKNIFLIASPFSMYFNSDKYFSFGPGVFFYSVEGSGGSTILDNGTSTTSFALPGKSKTSILWCWVAGLGLNYAPWHFDIDLITTAPFNNERRTLSLYLGVSYAL